MRPPPAPDSDPSRLVGKTVSRPGAPVGEGGSAAASPPGVSASDLKKRLATAAVAIPIIIACIWAGGVWWMVFVVTVIALGTWEFAGFMEAKGLHFSKSVGLTASVGLGLLAQGSNEYFVTILLTVTILLALIRQLGRGDISSAISGTSATLFGVIYVGWLGSHLILIRNLGIEIGDKYLRRGGLPVPQGFDDVGFFFVLLAVACTFLSDTGGYFFGRAWGKHKLAPSISPKKSWEGLLGSLLFAMAGGVLVKFVFLRFFYEGRSYAQDFGYGHCVIVGLLCSSFGLAGDLAESLLKRDARIKDASGLLPGHGGFLDRLDSLNFAVPLTYYYVKIYYYVHFAPDVGGDVTRLLRRYGIG
ncbi:MAG: phosphatidate cytidylyltransferase [Bdellovibrionota bacterium]